MTGIYLAIATLAFAVIIQEVFSRWESVTHGFAGMPVAKPVIFGGQEDRLASNQDNLRARYVPSV